ncbi:MAG: bifunctional adenosylcobinamide kinase/adenosylcobinamide-phosphate guanylyltransferase [Veillonella sp.]|uniref:bifunctional adenosylcobinamide kinase/adenosylcobinamide-phosphate guanylyltransferase n=2 Tax=Veillonellaceae TaxID=31977 RepID=UPI0009E13672|nr:MULTISPECIES: bifunctional adenosylcobinamide kinase/adenosylcobinamide-phosphate guanylyltransferase [Veillonella]ARF99246.1 bifunctional adenosylcobinamide kinase/adenosylcobinamide-phosphate guanylyltransferase [Veillonella atypica]MBF1740536.1 bifunctional adenosylcobinamide kinase/adenosylcobinamide-phosphate guanylyltransferase [Veillonella sp.]MCB6769669.1 bifunctional adenosylcobinamide kinase/adenosylcobinamide-phosphate guanylyltransferase [Veillonella atypica]MDU1261857.1 bifuncti
MKSTIILCSGGARSGKSEFAEQLALSLKGRKAYVATGQAFDDEMKDRIKKHQMRRGKEWITFEIPLHLHKNWEQIKNVSDVILIDCLTMFTSNHIFAHGDINTQEDSNRIESIILEELRLLLQEINNSNDKTVIFVTNEIGLGIVPENKLARYFRDITGRVNREVASAANKMYLTISGVTIELKSQEVHING